MDTQRRDPPKLAQASPAAVQTSQRKTKEQSSSGMQGPQHEPFRVGTVPAGQSGSGSSQEGEYPQLRVEHALEALAHAVGAARTQPTRARLDPPERPTGAITPEKLGAMIAVTLPENAIVVDESITTGRNFMTVTETAVPHDWILPTGGSIGFALPVAIGAAIACPERRVVCLESDGSGMYMPQSLWTEAREGLKILTLVLANRKYQILHGEMAIVGVSNIGPNASALFDIDWPTIDWVSLAASQGVAAFRAETMEELARHIDAGLSIDGPALIEVVL
jgi:acetolactate synthase-1/2/3 large subunit